MLQNVKLVVDDPALRHKLGRGCRTIEHLGEVQPHGHDEFVFVVNGQSVFFKKPHTHDLGVEEVSRLRRLLKKPVPEAHKSGARIEELANLIHRKESHYRGERIPEEDSFYEQIAKDITRANEIVLIGHATGKSNAADILKEYLKTHHPDISRRVIATESADLSAVTEPEIEALAKRHMIAVV